MPPAGTVRVALTRDSVCMADDVDAPHDGWIEVPADADPPTIGRAILRARYLASVMPRASWHFSVDDMVVILGDGLAGQEVLTIGETAKRARDIASLDVRYDLQEMPEAVRAGIIAYRLR